jgi:hypothetical protein
LTFANEFAQESIEKKISGGKKDGERIILDSLLKADDPETGQKLTQLDILSTATNLMYWILISETYI